jgi:type II secretion system (T2SS) protein G
MSPRRNRRSGSALLLPWERRRALVASWFSLRRWRGLLFAALFLAFIAGAWHVADRRTRIRATRASIAEVQRAVGAFRAEMGRCPRSKIELVHPPRGGARYLTEVPTDGWGRELYVRCPSPEDPSTAEVVSAGPSGSFSVDDNIL